VSPEQITHEPESRLHYDLAAWVQASSEVHSAIHPEAEHFGKPPI